MSKKSLYKKMCPFEHNPMTFYGQVMEYITHSELIQWTIVLNWSKNDT